MVQENVKGPNRLVMDLTGTGLKRGRRMVPVYNFNTQNESGWETGGVQLMLRKREEPVCVSSSVQRCETNFEKNVGIGPLSYQIQKIIMMNIIPRVLSYFSRHAAGSQLSLWPPCCLCVGCTFVWLLLMTERMLTGERPQTFTFTHAHTYTWPTLKPTQ